MHMQDILNGPNSLFAWEKSQHHPWIDYGTLKDRHGIRLVTDDSGTLILCGHDAHAQGRGRPRYGYKGLGDSKSLTGTIDRPRQVILRCHGPPHDKHVFLCGESTFPRRKLNACEKAGLNKKMPVSHELAPASLAWNFASISSQDASLDLDPAFRSSWAGSGGS